MAASTSSSRCSSSHHVPAHDIFLSHSGAQKPFVSALYELLREKGYSAFFDIQHHSLPLGEPFPPHIFHAARTCRLAVVVLSEEYVQSRWPMIELHAFVAANPPPKILPLFLQLTVDELKQKEKLDKWRSVWQKFAEEDRSKRIDVSAWESAFRTVSSHNGIPRNQCEEESAYIERVFARICETMPPSIRYDLSGVHGIHRLSEIVLNKFEKLDNNRSKVCVLGMHGLPGSGKSTICRYLYESLFSEFAGRAIYLELPTDAKDEELLVKSKELLKQLTNFNNKMDLSGVSKFREVYHLLKGTDIVRCKVFLVVDNISTQRSRDVVKALLRLDLTVGSKVLLVARSINVLRLLLQDDGSHQSSDYVYGCMSVPGLNVEEALRLLLQSGDGVGLVDSCALEAAMTPQDKAIMEEVVNMSAFSEEHCCRKLYLPLVLKIMGEQFQEHELNVETWSRTMKSFQTEIGLCKEEALKKMLLKSFQTLQPGSRLQNLFLDLALFIVPLSYLDGKSHRLDEACSHLSLIHGCKPEEIKFQMQKLQQHGFLTIWRGSTLISVHDFYLEFAASIEEASNYYWSSGPRWSKTKCRQAIEVVATTQHKLRTVVLELGEQFEHFEIPITFSGVMAMVLRNCMSLKTLRGFANLRSLASLEICNCPSLRWVELPAMGRMQPYVQRVKWVNGDSKKWKVKMLQQQALESSSSKKSLWRSLWENLPQIKRPQMTALDGLLLQMNGLQILKLENTGIRGYVDMSRCLPQLRVLEMREHRMKGLSVCNLPNLERFVFFGDAKSCTSIDIANSAADSLSLLDTSCHFVPGKRIMLGKEFLAGCPKVQEVYMQCAACEDEANQITIASSQLTHLRVNGVRSVWRLQNLISACSESLEEIMFFECEELRSLDFGGVFRNLRRLCLQGCANLTGVSGFGGLRMLERLQVANCPSLKEVSDVRDLVSLQYIQVFHCPNIQHFVLIKNTRRSQQCFNLPELESLIELREINYTGTMNVDLTSGKLMGLKGLYRLRTLHLAQICDGSGRMSCNFLVDMATLLGIEGPCCFSLNRLSLRGLANVTSLNGIEFLGSLTSLTLESLQNLSCLQGIECLVNLLVLHVGCCDSVEEMPSLATLVRLANLSFSDCTKLRSVEGCRELKRLRMVRVTGCKSLECFPLGSRDWRSSYVQVVSIEGSKFASEEVVAAWAMDEEVPKRLREASLAAISDFLDTDSRWRMIEMVIDKVAQKASNGCFNDEEDDDDGNYDKEIFVARLIDLAEQFGIRHQNKNLDKWTCTELPDKAVRCIAKLPKRHVIDLCKSNFNLPYLLCFLLFPDTLDF